MTRSARRQSQRRETVRTAIFPSLRAQRIRPLRPRSAMARGRISRMAETGLCNARPGLSMRGTGLDQSGWAVQRARSQRDMGSRLSAVSKDVWPAERRGHIASVREVGRGRLWRALRAVAGCTRRALCWACWAQYNMCCRRRRRRARRWSARPTQRAHGAGGPASARSRLAVMYSPESRDGA